MRLRRLLAVLVSTLLLVVVGIPTQFSAAWADGPVLTVGGSPLAGTTVTSPFTVTVTDPGTVDGAVKFLLDNVYLGQDTTAPYTWSVTAAAGAHTLKARWDNAAGARQELEAAFTVGTGGGVDPTPTPTPTTTTPPPGATPQVQVGGANLQGATVAPGTFTATLVDATVDDEVKFLLDNVYLGQDTTAPYTWSVTAAAGAHTLKVKWDSGGAAQQIEAGFTAGDPGTPTPTPTPTAGPKLFAGGADLNGATVSSPVAVSVVDPGTVSAAGVTFLLDDSYIGKDTTAPYEWTVVAAVGARKVKAKWLNGDGTEVSVIANFTVGSAANPALTADGAPLDGATKPQPFTAVLTAPGTVATAGVTWLIDNSYVGVDATAPYEWAVSLANGTHKIKARWTNGTASTVELVANFYVGEPGTEPDPDPGGGTGGEPNPGGTVEPPVNVVEPGPALTNLWATEDNRRNPVQGLYDWSDAGVGGGTVLADDDQYLRAEPECRITAAELATDYDVVPNDGGDDTTGLQGAIDDIKEDCSPTGEYTKMSIIRLPAGTLNVTRQISVDADYLRIRGQGRDEGGTRIVFRPDANTRYDAIVPNGSRWDLENMDDPEGDGQGGWIWPGRGLFRVQSREVHEDYLEEYEAAPANRKDLYEGTVNVHWKSGVKVGQKGADTGYAARKGDTTVKVATTGPVDFAEHFRIGGMVNVRVANSKKFYEEMETQPTDWPMDNLHMRQQIFVVVAGDPDNGVITLDRPLEYDVPIDSTSDGSTAISNKVNFSKIAPLVDAVNWVGFENFSFTQDMPNLNKADAAYNYGNMAPESAMHGIVFKWASNSWVKGIRAEMTGSHPIVTEEAAHLSIVDNEMDGSWNKGKGGNGYFRGSRVWSSLYAGNTTRNLRHFTFQWSASGNVAIGNSFDSDLNLHGGYERNNLFELNEVSIPYAHRSNNCRSNCGGEGGAAADDSEWYPIWWAAGKKAVKWSGSSGENNVFFNNHTLKQAGGNTSEFEPYYAERDRIYQFGTDADGEGFQHLERNGAPIADWAHNETYDYTGGEGVLANKTFAGRSLFLESVTLDGYGGPHPQTLKQSLGCVCWDGSGVQNAALAADPVNTATGSLMENFEDLSVDGPGRNLDWHRTYNSLDDTDGPLSQGWTFNYNSSLTPRTITPEDGSPPYDVLVFRNGSGGEVAFRQNAEGDYEPVDPAVTAVLAAVQGGGWRLENLQGDVLEYGASGQLVRDEDAQGDGVTLAYAGGRLSTLTDDLGQTLTLTWGTGGAALNKIVEVAAGDGRSISFVYNTVAGGARLTSSTDVRGQTTTYSYDAATGFVNKITDPLGNESARTVYDPVTKRATEQLDATGAKTLFAYDPLAQTTTVTFPDGTKRRDVYQGNVLVTQVGEDGRATDAYYGQNNEVIASNTADQGLTRSTYDDRGNLLERTLPAAPGETAPSEKWTYDGANRVTGHTDALGNTTAYDYDGQGRLVETTEPGGATTTLTYNALGQVATTTDPLDRTTSFEYNALGDVVRETSPEGNVTTWTYDAAHNRLTETGPLGNVQGADPADHTTTWTYDAAGNVLTETDALGDTTTSLYDDGGRLVKKTAPDGAETSYTYDENGDLLTETDPLGRVVTHAYDAAGRETGVTAPDGGRTTYTYDAAGRVETVTGPVGNATGASAETRRLDTVTLVYDAAGRVAQTLRPDPAAPAGNLVTTTEFDFNGRPVKTTGPDGTETTTTWDAAGNQLSSVSPASRTTATYDAAGRTLTTETDGVEVASVYDAAGQLVSTETGEGAVTTMAYDLDGRLTFTVDPLGNVSGGDPDDHRTTYSYDRAGRETKQTDPLGQEISTTYDAVGRTVTSTDPAGGVTAFEYDESGNLTKVTTPAGAVTSYTYDLAGQLVSLTNPKGGVKEFTYTDGGQIESESTPGDRTTGYAYDDAGRLLTIDLPDGEVGYTYDALGRTTAVDYDDDSGDLAYRYDRSGRPVEVTRTTQAGAQNALFTYDAGGRVTGVTRGADQYAYTWDDDGRLAQRTLPGGQTQTYTYDDEGSVASTTLGEGPRVDYTYDAGGQLTTVARADGPVTERTFDAVGQLTGLRHKAGGTTLVEQELDWNSLGLPGEVTTERGQTATTTSYTYDADGRLTRACEAAAAACGTSSPYAAYEYDPNGNRTKSTEFDGTQTKTVFTSYDTDDRPVQDSATQGGPAAASYVYDDNGNLQEHQTAAGTRVYDYGLDGNLRTATLEDGRIVGYAYDEGGNRTARTVNGAVDATWKWDTYRDLPMRISESDGTGAEVHRWWDDPVSTLGTALADTGAGADPTWLLGDFQGTVTDTADETALTGTGVFGPYGEEKSLTGAYPAGNPLRFHGQYRDSLTGLYDLRARDYDAVTGAFTGPDPAMAEQSGPFVQAYAYALNRPTALTDPSGRNPLLIAAILLGRAAGPLLLRWAVRVGGRVLMRALIKYYGRKAVNEALRIIREESRNPTVAGPKPGPNPGPVTDPGSIVAGAGGASAAAQAAYRALLRKIRRDFKRQDCPDDSVWDQSAKDRGFDIEDDLGGNLPNNYPVIDKWDAKSGTATSIKSIDTSRKTYRNLRNFKRVIEKYLNTVRRFPRNGYREDYGGVTIRADQVKRRVLALALPKKCRTDSTTAGHRRVVGESYAYGLKLDPKVNMNVYYIP
ncbi:RHS repeat-associated protein [Actinocorallia herbida]|uniref:RHS repeat-associated protein n=1 Tax=Actinocorallia herbida TaxID=58109 RepID=A0A3N1D034_9ACTN|nr:Ig-like domain-containing protein [Actinocorallia herbida]ROO86856.1 RHS repeat-associated protein [Actinocorallia herbida]